MDVSVVMFAKSPVPGRVKTRLAATIGDDLAARFHEAFIADLVDTLTEVEASRRVLAWAGDADHDAFAPAREAELAFVAQPGGNLGDRLDGVIRSEARRVDRVLVIGSDSPTLGVEHFRAAVDCLDDHDVALGPSFDGGYYLVGVRAGWYLDEVEPGRTHPLFREIDWSTTDVLGQTLRRCRQISSLCDLTAFWYDVDTFEDLKFLQTHLLEHLLPAGRNVASHTANLLEEMDRDTSNTHTV